VNTTQSRHMQVETTLDELGAWCAGCVALNICSTLQKIVEKTTEPFTKTLLQMVSAKVYT